MTMCGLKPKLFLQLDTFSTFKTWKQRCSLDNSCWYDRLCKKWEDRRPWRFQFFLRMAVASPLCLRHNILRNEQGIIHSNANVREKWQLRDITVARVFKFSRRPVQVTVYFKHLRWILFVFQILLTTQFCFTKVIMIWSFRGNKWTPTDENNW